MNKKELIKILITDIQDLYTITNRFENTENIHPLDVDLALSKVRNLYELLLKLNPQASYLSENQEKEISTPVKKDVTTVAEEKTSPPAKTEENPEVNKPLRKEKEHTENTPEVIIASGNEKKQTLPKEETEEDKTETEIPTDAPEIVADKFQSKKFVHDNISKTNTKKDVSSKMQSKPIQDINSAIGLNDKFIFIRELFNNDKDYYNETIQILNNFDNYENAIEFLNENFEWDEEDKNYIHLKELVSRKYS